MTRIVLLVFLLISHVICVAQKNQNIEVAKIESGSFSVYKMMEKGYNKFVFEKAKKNWPVELFKEGDYFVKILIKRVGILDEFFKVDLPSHPAYYHGGNANIVVTVIDKKIYYYTWSAAKGAKINYILTNGSPGKYVTEKELLDNYRRSIKNKQSGARDDRKEANAAIAAKEAEENSLKGKSIKSISLKLVDPPSEVGMFSVLSIGMEVTLTNGTVLKTKNLGGKTPYTDFETSFSGGDFTGGDFKVANDSREIPYDKIDIQVWSKFDSKVKGNFSYPLNYRSDVFLHYNGRGGAHGRGSTSGVSPNGGHGKDARSINLVASALSINGEKIIQVTATDASTGELLSETKINPKNIFTVNVSGGNGGNGCEGRHEHSGDGGNGGDGGNAGDVYLSGDGASLLQITVLNDGGNAGSGGSPKTSNYNTRGSNGSRGSKGSFVK